MRNQIIAKAVFFVIVFGAIVLRDTVPVTQEWRMV